MMKSNMFMHKTRDESCFEDAEEKWEKRGAKRGKRKCYYDESDTVPKPKKRKCLYNNRGKQNKQSSKDDRVYAFDHQNVIPCGGMFQLHKRVNTCTIDTGL